MGKAFFGILIILSLFLSSCDSLPFIQKEEGMVLPSEIRQWAIFASASDAYGGQYGGNRDDQSPFAATGEPDVENCEDDKKAWVISREDDGLHWLELEYDTEVHVSKIRVRESFGPGAVAKIELYDNGIYKTMWEGKDTNKACPGFFEARFEEKENNITKSMTPFATNKVKITLDTDVKGWNEIDAVELVGYEKRWYLYNETLFYE